jgi:aminomethyltransferase
MVPFAGWDMPVQYAGVMEECRSVRLRVGVFDISHMGRVRVQGAGAEKLLQKHTTNDVTALVPGRAQYSLMPTPTGGIQDDVIVYCMAHDYFLVVVNASNASDDIRLLRDGGGDDCEIVNESDRTCMIAVQGPAAVETLQTMAEHDLSTVARFAVADARVCGIPATLCRTGYTGEDGFEIIADASQAPVLWRSLLEAGAAPCGLGSRDSLRTEAGYPLYGHEIDKDTSPVEAGLMWAVKLDKGAFVGRESIQAVKQSGPSRRLMGIIMEGRAIPRQGYAVVADGVEVGAVTSGAFSALREIALGMAYVRSDVAKPGTAVSVCIRGAEHRARLLAKKDLLTAAA